MNRPLLFSNTSTFSKCFVVFGTCINLSFVICVLHTYLKAMAVGGGKITIYINNYNEGFPEIVFLLILLVFLIYDARYRVLLEKMQRADI